jgi:hypothetical protein
MVCFIWSFGSRGSGLTCRQKSQILFPDYFSSEFQPISRYSTQNSGGKIPLNSGDFPRNYGYLSQNYEDFPPQIREIPGIYPLNSRAFRGEIPAVLMGKMTKCTHHFRALDSIKTMRTATPVLHDVRTLRRQPALSEGHLCVARTRR